ncbi:ATP-dependent DNA helicase PIF1 [Colletotrichum costaricense]|uniref:ATP-dependent DNA helicase n=1 Tax=Colletotrichum costaricense TaxID=1209916 RepID=A0AAI9YJC0_9PEZI|nr:ATP-dependent DNA helicase PIF1 [Colletotrichum costaricense]KAK1513355.1 ATP-dependent DNA helicase PIF1 [Colletotrichum costaricense]
MAFKQTTLHFGPKRAPGGSLSPPSPKRQRFQPEPDHNDLTRHGDTDDDRQEASSGSQAEKDAEPSNSPPQTSVADKVNDMMRKYTSGIPTELSGAKKYYVVWNGTETGIFESWGKCQPLVERYPGAGHKKTTTYKDAVDLLRNKLTEKLEAEEPRSVPQPQPCTASPNTYESTPRYTPPTPNSRIPGSAAPSDVAAIAADAGEPQAQSFDPAPDPCEPPLCQEQQAAMDLAMAGHNLFITGSGGCGKSVLVKALHKMFKAKERKVHLIAPTGIASVNIGGRTMWNYAGWTPGDFSEPFGILVGKSRHKKNKNRIVGTHVLIIDEISMVENQFFQRLGQVMGRIRRKAAPNNPQSQMEVRGAFGGVQVIAVGDFCQLPPVEPFQHCLECGSEMQQEKVGNSVRSYFCPQGVSDEGPQQNTHGYFMEHDKWAFKSSEWVRCNFKYVHLKKVHRQTDEDFVRILQTCRLGEVLSQRDIDLLLNHPAQVENATRLFSHRLQAQEHNESQLKQLHSPSRKYWCLDYANTNNSTDEELDLLIKNYTASTGYLIYRAMRDSDPEAPPSRQPLSRLGDHRYAQFLELKLNMPVILLANIDLDSGLCNGSQGKICGFVSRSKFERPTEPKRKNYKKDLSAFDAAMERFRLTEMFFTDKGAPELYPEVEFNNGQRRVIGPDCAVNELGTKHPHMLVSRTQLPLAPGWAMTIHKSQSLSLDRLIVDLGSVFEKGQAYVALSRARSLQGLQIEGTDEYMLQSGLELDSEVRRFLEELERSAEGN